MDGHSPQPTGDLLRTQIIAGARRLFLHSGFRRVTMDELAGELGMSKKTLYQHFASKDELVRAVLEFKLNEIQRDLDVVLKHEDQSVPAQLKELLTTLQGHVAEIHPAFVRDIERSDPALFATIDERRQIIIRRYFGALLERGREEGSVRADVPPDVLVEMLLASARAVVNPARLVKYDLSPQQAFSQVLAVFLHGILTGKER